MWAKANCSAFSWQSNESLMIFSTIPPISRPTRFQPHLHSRSRLLKLKEKLFCNVKSASVLTYFHHSDHVRLNSVSSCGLSTPLRHGCWTHSLFIAVLQASDLVKPSLYFHTILFFRDSQNRNQLWGAAHHESLHAQVHERIRSHLLRGILQRTVCFITLTLHFYRIKTKLPAFLFHLCRSLFLQICGSTWELRLRFWQLPHGGGLLFWLSNHFD